MTYRAAVITVSDRGFRGERTDTSGPALCAILEENGFETAFTAIVPDEPEAIRDVLLRCADELQIPLILTTGGTGFAERDVTPEVTKEVITKEAPGLSEAMRAESMRITPRGCLSRGVSGIRGKSLIINLPGSEKAVRENLNAILSALPHGLRMLASEGSADCAVPVNSSADAAAASPVPADSSADAAPPVPADSSEDAATLISAPVKRTPPSMDRWMTEAKADFSSRFIGMYLTHSGKVRSTPRAVVRDGAELTAPVTGMIFAADEDKVSLAVKETFRMEGIHYVRTWFNEGTLKVGDDIMYVMIGADTRPHAEAALDFLVGKIKSECVTEKELFD